MTDSDAYDRVNRAIDLIEGNLTGCIDPERAAEEACFSLYHFHRLFTLVTGETPGGYIRRRRLSESARELVESDSRILDIALRYGFGSHEAYTRSFRKIFGVAPVEYRRAGVLSGYLPKTSIRRPIPIEGVSTMKVRVERLGGKKLVGIAYHGKNENDEVGGFWAKYWNRIADLPDRVNRRESYGFCFSIDGDEGGEFFYLVSVEVERFDRMPVDMFGKVIPESEYAIFSVTGLANVKKAYEYAYGTWLPSSGYTHAGHFDFEFYGEKFVDPSDPSAEIEICIPVVKA